MPAILPRLDAEQAEALFTGRTVGVAELAKLLGRSYSYVYVRLNWNVEEVIPHFRDSENREYRFDTGVPEFRKWIEENVILPHVPPQDGLPVGTLPSLPSQWDDDGDDCGPEAS